MTSHQTDEIQLIPIREIVVLNPRQRGRQKFRQIVANIDKLGLKRPVTVAQVEDLSSEACYYLVCGQGRLEAYQQLGAEFIPALVIKGTKEDLLLRSLVENIARRQHSTIELVQQIRIMKERGYSHTDIAKKTDLNAGYVRDILTLLARGEDKLLCAVERGDIPVSIAITIATADDKEVQRALADAYEQQTLRGQRLVRARRLIENRRSRGKSLNGHTRPPSTQLSSQDLLRTYQREAVRQKLVVQRAKVSETRLLFVVTALRQLLKDENFVTLLRAELLDTLPQALVESDNDEKEQS